MSNSIKTSDEYREWIADTVVTEHEDTGESTKLIFLREVLEDLEGLTSLWGEDPDYYHDNRAQASHHSPDWEYLDIILSEFRGLNKTITGYKSLKELQNRFKTGERSFMQALREGAENIEESNEIRGLFSGVYENQSKIKVVRFILVTDFPCISETTIPDKQEGGRTYRYLTYSLEKIYEIYYSVRAPAKLEINLEQDFNERIPCLEVKFDNSDSDYTSYLGYMKGSLLAEMYEKYNERLLEGNIRVFLQAKAAVNKGIRATLRKKDEKLRFFAYNNGISATAESVVVSTDSDGSQWIEKISGLQIVNGGQTTASIHNAKKEKVNLSGVYVQMKLTVPKNPAGLSELNPKIAEYSNSQNQIKKADFTANSPYHIRLEQLSRSVQIPGKEMYWFYERIRGGYDEFCRLESFKQKGKKKSDIPYDVKYPKSRRVTKTDVALHYNAWNQYPYFAANGGEKNFVKFTNLLKGEDGSVQINPDERYFHELIAMSILFIRTDTIVQDMQKSSDWGTGYKREIVLYTLSLFSYLSEGKLDLEKIWKYQSTYATPKNNTRKTIRLPDVIEDYILSLSKEVEKHVHQPPTYKKDAREWAKTEASWKSLLNEERATHIPVPDEIVRNYYLKDSEVTKREEWLASLRIEKEEEEAGEVTTGVQESEEVKGYEADAADKPEEIPVPDFRRIIATSSYNEWCEMITKISGMYQISESEKTLSSISRRKASGQTVISSDLTEIKELFCRLFDKAVTDGNAEYLSLFGIGQESDKTAHVPEKQPDEIPVPDFREIILNTGYNDWCIIVSKILDGYDVSDAGEKRLHAISKGKLSGPALKKDDLKAVTDLFTRLYLDAIAEGDSEYMSVFGTHPEGSQIISEDKKDTVSSGKTGLEIPYDIYEFLRKAPHDDLVKFINELEDTYSPDKDEIILLNHILTMRKNRLIIPPEEIIRVKDIIDRYSKS